MTQPSEMRNPRLTSWSGGGVRLRGDERPTIAAEVRSSHYLNYSLLAFYNQGVKKSVYHAMNATPR